METSAGIVESRSKPRNVGGETTMSEPIVYIDHSEVREGKLEELKTALKDLAVFVEANEPQILAYNVYFNVDESRVMVLHVHRDAASLRLHMDVAGPAFAPFVGLVNLLSIDVYGRVSDDVTERLRQKAQMLGDGTVRVHDLHAGFARFGAA
jgi:hypothetical protein